MAALWFGSLVLLSCPLWVRAYPSGAPTGACEDMMPRHMGVTPQTSRPPYTLLTDAAVYSPGKPITVTIVGPDYRGLLLEARAPGRLSALGTWQLPPPDTRFLECSGNSRGAVTHANINLKGNSTVFSWRPPDTTGPVYFMATVAEQRTVFWLNIRSGLLFRAPVSGLGLASATKGVAPEVPLLSAALCWIVCKTLL
ncbi:hypothetical protein NL108_012679 [Boleophthalmus pectinirostris]|uniref:putative defense protein Hdd11 n=1 Tax=Boleophthalmus pectinirostris TaxID=150288 RepID=UPI002430E539|nr:putative defense protein Hdd11 [Boleophthalmus pectinirostris]KAJ0067950.1 hypothetical protein NL108_012679 [Boleophthalmus pectinirostris]